MAIDWSDIFSRKVRDLFRVALSDKYLEHNEIVDILCDLLKDGELTGTEVNDLQKIAAHSTSIPQISKNLLATLGSEVLKNLSYSPFYYSTSLQRLGVQRVCDFLKRSGPQRFGNLDRTRVGVQLLLRIANPNIINQQNAGVCGPVSFIYGFAFDDPSGYAKFATELFENGRTKLGRLDIIPGSDCRNYSPPPPISDAEWLTAASLRDSENFFLDYDSVSKDKAGGSHIKELAEWFTRAGYTDVHWEKNRSESLGADKIALINRYYDQGYRIGLSINAKLLDPATQAQTSSGSNHLVVLRSRIEVTGQNATATIFTWGQGQFKIPKGTPLTTSQFLEHWYGYVVAKPWS